MMIPFGHLKDTVQKSEDEIQQQTKAMPSAKSWEDNQT